MVFSEDEGLMYFGQLEDEWLINPCPNENKFNCETSKRSLNTF